jgi:ATP-dependent DNA ligase
MKRLAPMLASVGTDVPQGEDWVFEPKYDGIRILAFVDKGAVALVSRNGLNKTHSFPEIADALGVLHERVQRPLVVDGEIVAMRGRTPARFQALQSRMHVSDTAAIAAHRNDAPAAFVAFDLLLDGKKSLVAEPWRVRRKHLAALLQPPGRTGALRLSDVSTNGERMGGRHRQTRRRPISPGPTHTRLAEAEDRTSPGVRRRRMDGAATDARAHRRAAARIS